MKIEADGRGLTSDEIKQALDSARKHKNFKIEDYEEQRKGLVKEIGQLLVKLDNEFAADMLKIIKEFHPELLPKTL